MTTKRTASKGKSTKQLEKEIEQLNEDFRILESRIIGLENFTGIGSGNYDDDKGVKVTFISVIEASEDVPLVGSNAGEYESEQGRCVLLAVTTKGDLGILGMTIYVKNEEQEFIELWMTNDTSTPLGVVELTKKQDKYVMSTDLLNNEDGTIELSAEDTKVFGVLINVDDLPSLEVGNDYQLKLEISFDDDSTAISNFSFTLD